MPIGYSGAPRVTQNNMDSRLRRLSRSLKTGNNGTPLKITLFSSEEFNFEGSPNPPNTCIGGKRPVWNILSTEFPNSAGALQFPFVRAGYDNCCGYIEFYCYDPGTNTYSFTLGVGGPDYINTPGGLLFQDPSTGYVQSDPGLVYNTTTDQLTVCANTTTTDPQLVICQENSGDASLSWRLLNTATNTDAAGYSMGIDHSRPGFPLLISVGNSVADPSIILDNTGKTTVKELWAQAVPIVTVNTNTVIAASDCRYTILVDASAGAVQITLPAIATVEGREYRVSKIDTSNNVVTVKPNGAETISGLANVKLELRGETLDTQCDNTQWWVL